MASHNVHHIGCLQVTSDGLPKRARVWPDVDRGRYALHPHHETPCDITGKGSGDHSENPYAEVYGKSPTPGISLYGALERHSLKVQIVSCR